MGILQKATTATGYILRPSCYSFLYRLLKSKALGLDMSLDNTQSQSREWCSQTAVSTNDALGQLGMMPVDPRNEHPDVFAASDRAVSECPQKMGGAGNLTLLHSMVLGAKAKQIIETGVAYGWSSLAILLALREAGGGHLMSTNLHYREYDGDEKYVGCAIPEDLRDSWTLVPKADELAIPEIREQMPTCDLVHYDSAKSYSGRMAGYGMLWPALKEGGFFISDDIDDNLAFKHFCVMSRSAPIIVETPQADGRPTKWVGILRKSDSKPLREIVF